MLSSIDETNSPTRVDENDSLRGKSQKMPKKGLFWFRVHPTELSEQRKIVRAYEKWLENPTEPRVDIPKLALARVLAEHERWIRGAGGRRANLSGMPLKNWRIWTATKTRPVQLGRAVLFGADLTGARLFSADLSGAVLRKATIASANLRFANLSGADARNADFHWARLARANFAGAILVAADFRGADITGADFTNANLTAADLTGVDLSSADFTGANLRWAIK